MTMISDGKCCFCNGVFSKAAMTKHLKSCSQRKVKVCGASGKQKANNFHLVVEGRFSPEYWMHLFAPADTTLESVDSFLRDIWLECCGHLSAFTIKGISYSSSPMEDYEEKGMNVRLGDVLFSKAKFSHEYDFGTTTELTLRVVSETEGEAETNSVQLMARNNPPEIICGSCGKKASRVCVQCADSGEGWLCDKCAAGHECGADMFLPVVNSPRVGMCGYPG